MFVYHGYRYILVQGVTAEQATDTLLTYKVIHADMEERGLIVRVSPSGRKSHYRAQLRLTDEGRKAQIQEEINKINQELGEVVDKNRELIRSAKSNNKDVDKRYVASLLMALEAEYAQKFEAAASNPEALAVLTKEYKKRCRVAKKSKIITQIQMIF